KDFDPSGDNAIVFDGNWHHIVVSHARNSVASFYVDGSLINTIDISDNASGDIGAAGVRVLPGHEWTLAYDHGSSSAYNDDLDEAAVWTRALSADEVAQIYGAARQGFRLYAITDHLVFYAPFSADVNDVQGNRVAHVNSDAQRIASGGAV